MLIEKIEENLNSKEEHLDLFEYDFWGDEEEFDLLKGATHLKALGLGYNHICYLSRISNLTQLNELYLSNNKIDNISDLGNLTELTELNLHNNQITDISSLAHLTKLKSLDLSNNQITDISSLSNLIKLEKLKLSDNKITDISSLTNLTQLKSISLSTNKITDISILSNLNKLESLFIDIENLSVSRYLCKILKNHRKKYNFKNYEELPEIEKIWQIIKTEDEENIELAKQIALGLGWSIKDFQKYQVLSKLKIFNV